MVGTCHEIAIAGNEKQFADDPTFDIFSDWMTRSAYFCATCKIKNERMSQDHWLAPSNGYKTNLLSAPLCFTCQC